MCWASIPGVQGLDQVFTGLRLTEHERMASTTVLPTRRICTVQDQESSACPIKWNSSRSLRLIFDTRSRSASFLRVGYRFWAEVGSFGTAENCPALCMLSWRQSMSPVAKEEGSRIQYVKNKFNRRCWSRKSWNGMLSMDIDFAMLIRPIFIGQYRRYMKIDIDP